MYFKIFLPEKNIPFLKTFRQIIEDFSQLSLSYEKDKIPGQRTKHFLATENSWETRRLDLCTLSTVYLKKDLMYVDCYGEAPGEIWREYYLEGQIFTAEAEIIFPNLSEVQR